MTAFWHALRNRAAGGKLLVAGQAHRRGKRTPFAPLADPQVEWIGYVERERLPDLFALRPAPSFPRKRRRCSEPSAASAWRRRCTRRPCGRRRRRRNKRPLAQWGPRCSSHRMQRRTNSPACVAALLKSPDEQAALSAAAQSRMGASLRLAASLHNSSSSTWTFCAMQNEVRRQPRYICKQQIAEPTFGVDVAMGTGARPLRPDLLVEQPPELWRTEPCTDFPCRSLGRKSLVRPPLSYNGSARRVRGLRTSPSSPCLRWPGAGRCMALRLGRQQDARRLAAHRALCRVRRMASELRPGRHADWRDVAVDAGATFALAALAFIQRRQSRRTGRS